MKRMKVLVWVTVFIMCSAVLQSFSSEASPCALPRNHPDLMKNEDYKTMFEQFSAAVQEARARLDDAEYEALEEKCARELPEIAKKAMKDGDTEADAYWFAYLEYFEYVDTLLTWDWLKRNANGIVGFYRLQSDKYDGYLTVQEGDDKDVYAFALIVSAKGNPDDNYNMKCPLELKDGKMILDNSGETGEGTVEVSFVGETAHVATSNDFKDMRFSGELDGEYARERK